MKILFIEDNSALIESIKEYLGASWNIKATASGQAGVKLAKNGNYDAIVLDLTLPDMDGKDICTLLRKANITTPILILTGMGESDIKVALLNSGADDYVTKPFNPAEFRARLLALLRRSNSLNGPSPHILKVDTLVLDPLSRHVKRSGQVIALRRKEFDILEYLMRNRGKVVTRSMIMDNVWDSDTSSWNNTIDVHIKYLRDKIDRPFKRKLIKTAYGVGYTITDKVWLAK